jgi:hypothetical protein
MRMDLGFAAAPQNDLTAVAVASLNRQLHHLLRRQYLYFCPSKASKLSTADWISCSAQDELPAQNERTSGASKSGSQAPRSSRLRDMFA